MRPGFLRLGESDYQLVVENNQFDLIQVKTKTILSKNPSRHFLH